MQNYNLIYNRFDNLELITVYFNDNVNQIFMFNIINDLSNYNISA